MYIDLDAVAVADRAELSCWATSRALTCQKLQDEIEAIGTVDKDAAAALATQSFEVFAQRAGNLGAKYSFHATANRLVYSEGDEGLPYLFCLALACVPATAIGHDQRTVAFERLARDAAVAYCGGAAGVQTGASWQKHGHSCYRDALEAVLRHVPELAAIEKDKPPGGGDCGWDVVVVRSFADRRAPRLLLLGNCATGRTDWLTKGRDTAPEYWFRHFFGGRTPDGPVLTFCAFPFAATDDEWSRKMDASTILFDRSRLAEWGAPHPDMNAWLSGVRETARQVPLA